MDMIYHSEKANRLTARSLLVVLAFFSLPHVAGAQTGPCGSEHLNVFSLDLYEGEQLGGPIVASWCLGPAISRNFDEAPLKICRGNCAGKYDDLKGELVSEIESEDSVSIRDRFSVRITGRVEFDRDGLYRFTTFADDGVRVWVNNRLVVDDWSVHAARKREGDVRIREGIHKVTVDYFERTGKSILNVNWRRIGN